MTRTASTLYSVQSLELAIDNTRQRLEEIEQALANDEKVAACRAKLDTSEKAHTQIRSQIKDLELELASLIEKIKEVDTLLYSGRILNPKELQDRQNELESLKRRQQSLEEQLLTDTNDADKKKTAYENAQVALDSAVETRDRENADLISERDDLNAEMDSNLKRRKAIVADIPDNTFKAYRKLRKKKSGRAVALLKDQQCSLCGIEQTSQHTQLVSTSEDLVYCKGCGRILTVY
jgi:predicted  nucleic acid-binding Zn-ribbon protein